MNAQAAFREGLKMVNAKLAAGGVAPLTGHDIAIIVAHGAFERKYNDVLSRLQPGQEAQFAEQAPQFAAKCIASALLA